MNKSLSIVTIGLLLLTIVLMSFFCIMLAVQHSNLIQKCEGIIFVTAEQMDAESKEQ